jgi:histidinol-phosphate aminotransferase
MSPLVPMRADLDFVEGYHSPMVEAQVRLNVNESPFAPPDAWRAALVEELSSIEFNRYPDRSAVALRAAIADFHGISPGEVFCANGSDEVLQCLLLAFGGTGRRALTFEPTYALHSHIARITGTEVVTAQRDARFRIDPGYAAAMVDSADPSLTFLCSPNNPTGNSDPPELAVELAAETLGLVVVDEAYGQFAKSSALELFDASASMRTRAMRRVAVVRTFSKTWSLAATRLGYLVADPEIVAACEQVVLPYHLSALTQASGRLALRFGDEMAARVRVLSAERDRVAIALKGLAVETWHSDANFILFRPLGRRGQEVWESLLERSVLIRNCSSWPGLPNCLRVTVGTPDENDRFLSALKESL